MRKLLLVTSMNSRSVSVCTGRTRMSVVCTSWHYNPKSCRQCMVLQFKVDAVLQGFANLPCAGLAGLLFAVVLHQAVSILLRRRMAGISANKLVAFLSCISLISLDFCLIWEGLRIIIIKPEPLPSKVWHISFILLWDHHTKITCKLYMHLWEMTKKIHCKMQVLCQHEHSLVCSL